MKLFELVDWNLQVSEEAWGIPIFKKILDRDKSKNKDVAFQELLFVYFFTDLRSDYIAIINEDERKEVIKKDIGLPKTWKEDKLIFEAIDFYISKSETVISKLYRASIKAADDISVYLNKTDQLLSERDKYGKPVYQLSAITTGLKSIKSIMQDLKLAYAEVIAESNELAGKKKGAQEFNTFEDGLNIDE